MKNEVEDTKKTNYTKQAAKIGLYVSLIMVFPTLLSFLLSSDPIDYRALLIMVGVEFSVTFFYHL
ncbi:hypothetical protein [Risungbinella massiliensis]|uniref:hypothetical protein n=1 Tax=Risungbinella massiliensis TaxID=1329796 RepID=UPI0005CB9CC4|nr:hypothetical protein [Risungbinella massiliensis]